MKNFIFLGFALVLISWSSPAAAQWVPVAQKKGFGQALDADAHGLLVGDPENTYKPGNVFAYGKGSDGSWTESASLEASDGTLDDRFGAALDVEAGRGVVGAPAANAVYVFRRDPDSGTWTEMSRVVPADSASRFGTSVELAGDRLFVGASVPGSGGGGAEEFEEESSNAVYVFKRANSGRWQEAVVLQTPSIDPGGRFGATLLADEGRLVVGAPEHERGAVVVYLRNETGWTATQTLAPAGLTENARFGAALEWADDRLLVGAPRTYDATGGVYVVASSEDEWAVERRLLPFNGSSNQSFGAALAYEEGELWVGAPDAGTETGALYRFQFQDGAWTGVERIVSPSSEEGTSFGETVATSGSTVAVGLPGDRHGGGSMGLYSSKENAWTEGSPVAPSEDPAFSAVTGKEVRCTDGRVSEFSCKNVDLKAFLPRSQVGAEGGVELSDIWGWTDPETGTEYALVGRADGTAFVDVSTPTNPVYVGELPKTEGSRVNSWRDIKVYESHAFIVADNVGDHGMQVFDLTQLRDVTTSEMPMTFEATARYDRINSAHNLAINEDTGYAYLVGGSDGGETCGGGLHMVNVQDPLNPTFEGCFGGERGAGSGGTGATHDTQCILYEGPDREYQGREICVGFNETEIAVVDVTDKADPELLSTASYPNYGYVHQGWFTEDQRYMYSNDEADELQRKVDRTRTIVWDMTDLDNPTVANQLLLSTKSSDHDLYVKGDTMYQSNYKSGLRVLDVSTPEAPKEVGHFNLFPPSNTPGFEGTWGNYPFFESGIVVTATYDGGFFVLEHSEPEL